MDAQENGGRERSGRSLPAGRLEVGRNREYDEDAVMTGAMHAFRRAGYGAMSIRDLESATGIRAGSLYHRYADKAGLFAAALDHYNETVLRRRITDYAPPGSGLSGLRRLFLTLTDEPEGHTYGCLITNSAIEFGGAGPVPEAIRRGLDLLMQTFRDRLDEAGDAGRLALTTETGVMAGRLLALYQGVLVLLRAGWPHAHIIDLTNSTFDEMETRP